MGWQTALHMLAEDCKELVSFLQARDPVIVVPRDSSIPQIDQVHHPWESGGLYSLWNQALLGSLEREYIPNSNSGPYYRVNDDLPVVEFFFPNPQQELWNGRSALTQGRIYTGINAHKGKAYVAWYKAIVRWIRREFVKNPVPLLGGFVGPAAYAWYREGGTLLPIFRPPLTSQWLSWTQAQDQHRKLFSCDATGP